MIQDHLVFTDRRRATEPIGWHNAFNSLGTYHAAILITVFLWGVCACAGVDAPQPVTAILHGWAYWLWAAVHLLAPLLVFFGQALRRSAIGRFCDGAEQAGWQYECSGDAAIGLVTVTTMAAFALAHEVMIAIFFGLLTASAAGLAIRDWLRSRASDE